MAGCRLRRGTSYSQDILVLIETNTWRQTVLDINSGPILTCRELLELPGLVVAVSWEEQESYRD